MKITCASRYYKISIQYKVNVCLSASPTISTRDSVKGGSDGIYVLKLVDCKYNLLTVLLQIFSLICKARQKMSTLMVFDHQVGRNQESPTSSLDG